MQQHPHKTDSELLAHYYSDGNTEWLGIILQRYTSLLLGVCLKYLKNEDDAKDAVQQVFFKALGELQKYEVAYFKSWLYMIAKNYCLMKLRNKGKITAPLNEVSLPADNDLDSKESQQLVEQNLTLLEKALLQLNIEQRNCITLFYLEKKAYQDIVNSTNYTLMQVKSHIQNGKRNLKIYMDSKHNNE